MGEAATSAGGAYPRARGQVAKGFEEVRVEFERNFAERGEIGAAVSAYWRGGKVVDLWGGRRLWDGDAPWEEDTMVVVYSTTKGISAMTLAVANARGWLDYEAPTTIFNSGTTEDVLPTEARAVVNFQILPGDSVQRVVERVRTLIADPVVTVQPVAGGLQAEPSPISDVAGPAFAAIAKSIRQTAGGNAPLVVPFLTGPTDSRHWSTGGCRNVFRFTPFPYEGGWMSRAHGTDERIAVQGLADGVRFYVQLILNSERI